MIIAIVRMKCGFYILDTGYLSDSRINSLVERQSEKYLVLPGSAIYPATDLDGLSLYVRALAAVRVLIGPSQRHDGSRPTDDLNPSM